MSIVFGNGLSDNRLPLAFTATRPRFAAHSTPPPEIGNTDDFNRLSPGDRDFRRRLARYEEGLKALAEWDRTTNPENPVFLRMDVPRLVESGRIHLLLKRALDPSTPSPLMIGIAGGSASGKTTVKDNWLKMMPSVAYKTLGWKIKERGPVVGNLYMDHYYNDTSTRRQTLGDTVYFRDTNLDVPEALNLKAMQSDLLRIKNGQAVKIPHHTFSSSSTRPAHTLKSPTPLFIAEGLFAFANDPLRKLFDLTIFVEADEKTRAERWWKRAPKRNIREDEAGKALFNRTMSAHNDHVAPQRDTAHLVISGVAPIKQTDKALKKLSALLLDVFIRQ